MKMGTEEYWKGKKAKYHIMTRVNIQSDARREEDKLLLPLIPLVVKHSFPFFCPLFSHIICLLIWFGWLGQWMREKREKAMWGGGMGGVLRKRDRHREIEPERDKVSVCHAQKRCWVGRLQVPSHDKEQKEEGCRPDQVGAAWQMEHYDYSLLGREKSVW